MRNKNSGLSSDLSNYHNPVGALFEQPKNAAEWEQYVLSQDQVESFRENGYISGIKILNDKQVYALNEELGACCLVSIPPSLPALSLLPICFLK